MSSSLTVSADLLTAGLDYITVSASRPSGVAGLIDLGADLIREQHEHGCTIRPMGVHGYRGWSAGPVSYGFNGHSALLRCSGPTTESVAPLAIDRADKCSRLDMQITTRADAQRVDYHQRLYARLAANAGRRGRPLSRSVISQSDGGGGLYLGRRISDQFGRVYNKSAEERVWEDPPRWRYEVEFKRSVSLGQARAYRAAADSDRYVVNQVAAWFRRRGVDPPIASDAAPIACSVALRGAEREARLRWLAVGVAPALRELAAELGWYELVPQLGIPLAILRDPLEIDKVARD